MTESEDSTPIPVEVDDVVMVLLESVSKLNDNVLVLANAIALVNERVKAMDERVTELERKVCAKAPIDRPRRGTGITSDEVMRAGLGLH